MGWWTRWIGGLAIALIIIKSGANDELEVKVVALRKSVLIRLEPNQPFIFGELDQLKFKAWPQPAVSVVHVPCCDDRIAVFILELDAPQKQIARSKHNLHCCDHRVLRDHQVLPPRVVLLACWRPLPPNQNELKQTSIVLRYTDNVIFYAQIFLLWELKLQFSFHLFNRFIWFLVFCLDYFVLRLRCFPCWGFGIVLYLHHLLLSLLFAFTTAHICAANTSH